MTIPATGNHASPAKHVMAGHANDYVKRHAFAVCAILIWTLSAGAFLAFHDSMTTDEDIHIASAYLALTRHDFRFDSEHPFLFKVITALPLLALHPNLPSDDQKDWKAAAPSYYDSWREAREWSENWFYASGNNAGLMILLARIPAVLMLTLTVWLTYWISRKWFGPDVAIWAMGIAAFNPMLIGHGHLANTDIPLVTTFLIGVYAVWRYGERPDITSALWFGLACLAAMLSKFSGILLVPIFIIYAMFLSMRRRVESRKALGHVGAAALLVYCGIWLAYLFKSQYVPGAPCLRSALNHLQPLLQRHGHNLDQLAVFLAHILPMQYLKAAFIHVDNAAVGRGTYLFGHEYRGGVWFYFPILYLLKTPLVALALLAGGAWLTFKNKTGHSAHAVLGLSILVYLGIAMLNKLDIGIRHILPLFPLLSIYMAIGAVALVDRSRRLWVEPGLALMLALPVAAWFPSFINYSNVLVSPPSAAWRYYNDSNLDWGQDIKAIAAIVRARFPSEPVYFNPRWSPYALSYYRVTSQPFDPATPPHDGIAVLSATQLCDPAYAIFRNAHPAASISNSTFIYMLGRR
ncbi:MAG: glycosyltransferase family 39 protein [Capsulimonadaceae bacterium]|nr:glycosyltransferase family 39 protein [Capsulimonadaceae bacterium]